MSVPMDLVNVLRSGPAPLTWKLGLAVIYYVPCALSGLLFGLATHGIANYARDHADRRTPD